MTYTLHLPSNSTQVKENINDDVMEINVTQPRLHYMTHVCNEITKEISTDVN